YILVAITYAIIGLSLKVENIDVRLDEITVLKEEFQALFNFDSILLVIIILLPVAIVLIGSFGKEPTVPTLILSALVASIVGLFVHRITYNVNMDSLHSGFDIR